MPTHTLVALFPAGTTLPPDGFGQWLELALLLTLAISAGLRQTSKHGNGWPTQEKAELAALRATLTLSQTVENRWRLADALLRQGHPEEAVEHYQRARHSPGGSTPELLLGQAQAYFCLGQYSACEYLLEDLPELCSPNLNMAARLLHARVLTEQGRLRQADAAYRALLPHALGPEARYRYALLLFQRERLPEAMTELEQLLDYAHHSSAHYRRQHARWLTLARAQLRDVHRGRARRQAAGPFKQ
ncbi:MAG: hypothetical protein GAK43_01013 [Stenotrophomonas maltophilia]|nr:MAG: hypothetical protein GAK43_01013 [Stenotrophomonas maltophilia]